MIMEMTLPTSKHGKNTFKNTLVGMQYGVANALILAAIIAVACGGWPIWVVLAAIYLLGGPLDEVLDDTAGALKRTARWFCDANLYVTLPLLLLLTGLLVRRVGAGPGWLGAGIWDGPAVSDAAAMFLLGTCYAMFGATVAHELTHRSQWFAQISAHGLLALTFNSSFTVFHVHGHHRYVGTSRDPATARRGEHIVAFLFRTVAGQYAEAFRHEAARLRAAGASPWSLRNRVFNGQYVSLALIAATAWIGGWNGVITFFAAATIGRILHEFVNYIQHYGLVRAEGTPVGVRHTWDSCRMLSGILYYNLPRHADHHLFASKPYWLLSAAPQAPVLPFGYMTMTLVALVPPLWRRTMAPRLADWDRRLANEAERREIRQRGWNGLC